MERESYVGPYDDDTMVTDRKRKWFDGKTKMSLLFSHWNDNLNEKHASSMINLSLV